ncbi:ATP-dependent DNA ligase, partial [Candidatus Woesearchaeota archaeon]|nr:ATP-dependent DNA ligase [Candidatus Woesearchaeota archaeon]
YIVRTVLEDLRVGVGDGSLRDAIVWAYFAEKIGMKFDRQKNEIILEDRAKYNEYANAVQRAYDVSNDFSVVALKARKKGLKGFDDISLQIGNPLKVMLYQKAKGIEDAFSIVGKPAAFEYKYDGFRMQIHKKGNEIKVFTRRLENVTKQFPEIVKYVKDNVRGKSFILDCEAVGYSPKTGKYKPFQEISQRIKRKYDIEKMAKELPVEVNVFDIISFEGKNLVSEHFMERRKIIEKIVKESPRKIVVAKQIITSDEKEADKFYKESLKKGNEGVMVKNLDAVYKPGSRVGYGVKVKPTMEELDLVIVGAEWGTGKRGGWLSSFVLACIDDEGNFLEVGKVGTGIKEKEEEGASFSQLTEMLKPLIKSEKGREVKVKPEVVVEITYEEIQKSPTYGSGYALRFPRLLRIRDDRRPEEINNLNEIEDLFYEQKKR